MYSSQVPWGVEDRAYRSIPSELYLDKSTIPEAGLGIFSKSFIPKYTWLGEYEGEVLTSNSGESYYMFTVRFTSL